MDEIRPAMGAIPIQFALPGGVYNRTPTRIVFGVGSVAKVAEEVERLGGKRALVLTTPGRKGLGEEVARALGARCAGVYPKAISQVPIELAKSAHADAVELGVDCLVAVGGGAGIGLGKGIALYSGLPLITVPTTYSGSEMTGFCGITIDGVKRMHTSLNMLPQTVVYDPELTLPLPLQTSTESAMNALAHCIEALYVPTASRVTALAAMEGVRVICNSLPQIVRNPQDIGARTRALFGSYLGGVALAGGFALHHGVAHVLGGTYGLPHGVSHSVALPYVTAFNEDIAPGPMRNVAEILGAETASRGIHKFAKSIGAPVRLSDYSVSSADIDRCADIVLETDNGLNPKPVRREDVQAILEAALEGSLRP